MRAQATLTAQTVDNNAARCHARRTSHQGQQRQAAGFQLPSETAWAGTSIQCGLVIIGLQLARGNRRASQLRLLECAHEHAFGHYPHAARRNARQSAPRRQRQRPHGSLTGYLCGGGSAGARGWLTALELEPETDVPRLSSRACTAVRGMVRRSAIAFRGRCPGTDTLDARADGLVSGAAGFSVAWVCGAANRVDMRAQ